MNLIKIFAACIVLAFFLHCDSSGSNKNNEDVSANPDTSTTTTTGGTDNGSTTTTTQTTTNTNIPVVATKTENTTVKQEDTNKEMNTILFYDGSAKSYDGQNLVKLFDCVDLIKAGDFYFAGDKVIDSTGATFYNLPEKAIKACEYNNILFYYTENNNLYMINADGISLLVATNTYTSHSVILTDSGIRFELSFFDYEAGAYNGQFVGYDVIMKMEKINTTYKKYWFNGSEFIEVGSGLYSQFVRWHSLNINGIDYYTSGAIFDRVNLKLTEPTFDSLVKEYKGGSAFIKYNQPDKIVNGVNLNTIGRPHFIGIGVYNNNGYFLNAKDGKVYIFNPELNTITEWIKIIDGINSDDRPESFALFDKTNAFVSGAYIIYFDGSKIQQINIDTGEKKEIAEATNFKGYNQ